MICINEFELYEHEGAVLAVPFGMEGGTFGSDFAEAVESAADWLMETARASLMRGIEPVSGSLGNSPLHGGKVVVVAVECRLDDVEAITAAEAARALGVSSARIAQMCAAGLLVSWKEGSRRMVALESVKARLAEAPKAGRPKKIEVMHSSLDRAQA